MKRFVVSQIHRALKRPELEAALREGYRRGPSGTRSVFRKLAPQPDDYAKDEERHAERGGLRWHLYPYAYFQWVQYFGFEDPVRDVLVALARHCTTILDVGANVGFYSLLMARAARPGSIVFSFEPNPETFGLLSRHRDENQIRNCEIHAVALGDQIEQRTLFAGRDVGKFSLVAAPNRTLDGAKEVAVTTMDAFVRDRGMGPVDLIKIDVEGHEPAVILGGRETIQRDAPYLCFELTPLWYEKDNASAEQAFRWLADQPYRFYRVAQPEAPGDSLTGVDLVEELTRKGGPKQLNLVGIPNARGPADALVSQINAKGRAGAGGP